MASEPQTRRPILSGQYAGQATDPTSHAKPPLQSGAEHGSPYKVTARIPGHDSWEALSTVDSVIQVQSRDDGNYFYSYSVYY